MEIKICGVVVLYNPNESVVFNINGYLKGLSKLYVIDNSENGCNKKILEDILQLDDKKIDYIGINSNKGIAYALNMGIKKAKKEKFEWILTMDQDSSFYNDIIGIYKKYIMENPENKAAILSPQYKTDRMKLKTKLKEYSKIYWTMQSGNLINIKITDKIGLFLEKYFIDCVDYEYCLRARKQKFQIIRCNRAVLNHNPAITKTKKILLFVLKYGYASPDRIYYQIRNSLAMFGEYHNIRSLGIVIVKILKVVFLYEYKRMFFISIKDAFFDYHHKIFGKKDEIV